MPLKVDELVSYRLLSEGEKDLSAFELVDEWDIRGEYWNHVISSLLFNSQIGSFILNTTEIHWHGGEKAYLTILSRENAEKFLRQRYKVAINNEITGKTAQRIEELLDQLYA